MRMPRKDQLYDYAIIGAGLGGLAAAAALARRAPQARIAIFEAAAEIGGRVNSRTLDATGISDLAVIEYGAGRFDPHRHPRLAQLISDLGIATRPFDFKMVRATPGAAGFAPAETLARLHALRETAPTNASFRAVVEPAIGPQAFEVLVDLSGYDTLRRDDLLFIHGLEIISAHPETESIWDDSPGEWRSVQGGFRRLTEGLADRLGGNVDLHLNYRVTRLIRTGGAVTGLVALGPGGEMHVGCRSVVCATPLHDLLGLSAEARALVDYDRQVTDVPLVKGYLEFEHAFWPQDALTTRGLCVVSDTAFRKLYFSGSHPRMFFYCDGVNAERLAATLAAEGLPGRFARDLPRILPDADTPGVAVTRSGWRYWRRGISYWSYGRQPVAGPVWAPEPGLVFLSDINTPDLGWLEGALAAAEQVGPHVEPAPPAPADTAATTTPKPMTSEA